LKAGLRERRADSTTSLGLDNRKVFENCETAAEEGARHSHRLATTTGDPVAEGPLLLQPEAEVQPPLSCPVSAILEPAARVGDGEPLVELGLLPNWKETDSIRRRGVAEADQGELGAHGDG
jgi:hypothetical protein